MRAAQTDAFWEAAKITTKEETTLNVQENAPAMLGQVQSHLANVKGKVKKLQAEIG